MSIQSAINSAPSLRTFGTEAQKGETVALKKDGLQAQPAKQSFLGRVMQWIRGENPARINSDTKEAFVAAMTRRFGSKAADTALAQAGFHGGNDQPLSSREIKRAIGYAKIAEGGGAASPSGVGGAAQPLQGATKDMLTTRAETVKLAQDARKFGALVTRFQISNDPRLGAAQAKLADIKQSLAQTHGKLNDQIAQVNQLASGAPSVSVGSTAVKPSADTSSAARNAAPGKPEARAQAREPQRETVTQFYEQRSATRAEHKQTLQQMRAEHQQMREETREQAKIAREQSRAEQAARRDESKAMATQAKADRVQQRDANRAQQRELQAQARLEHKEGVQQNLEKMRASAESLLAQTSNMVDREWAALQAEIDESSAKIDAFSEALARPIRAR